MVGRQLILLVVLSLCTHGCTHYNIVAAMPDLNEVKRVWNYCSRCITESDCREKNECEEKTVDELPYAFDYAITAQSLDIVRYFVEVIGIDLNSANLNPLHSAAYYNSPKDHEILSYLISRGAKVNAISMQGHARSPLNVAIWKRNTVGARLLLAAGADPSIESDRGWDACMFAHRWSHWEIMPDLPGCCERFLDTRWDGDPDEARVRPPELMAACQSTIPVASTPKN